MKCYSGRLSIVAVMLSALLTTRAMAAERFNVVFILADDLGWSDTTLYGTTQFYQTPNIQRLARRGMTFTRAYAASPLCSPTRASILTGLSPARHGITAPTCHTPQVVLQAVPGKRAAPNQKCIPVTGVSRLKPEYRTLAETLKEAGYATSHFGKWHLGHEPYSPLEHGFDVDVPHWPGPGPAGSYVAPWKFPDFDPDTPNQHIEDRMAKEAVQFLERHQDEPFFLNYWMFSVHAPFDAKRGLIDKYRKRVNPSDPQRSPTYAAMIESMDDAVGTLLDTLDRLEIADRTIIVFASDNGGNMYNEVDGTTPTSNTPLRGGKATMFEGGVRGPAVVVWPGRVDGESRSDEVIQSCDYYPTLLEMLGLQRQLGQEFDGLSIVPALKGEPLGRDAIFTYFPHNPRVPDWLPPSVSVHRGDWKLIRIFHGGKKGAHRWKLFNLREDLGEQHDLAGEHPERVRELDGLIDRFLADTNAVVPTLNPDFDPATYRIEDEGKSTYQQRGASKGNSRSRKRAGPPVAGWVPGNHCRLAVKGGALVVTSTGNDPHFSFRLTRPLKKGDYRLQIRMASNAGGRGQFFWHEKGITPSFFRDRSVSFPVISGEDSRDYALPLTAAHDILAVRFDPAQSAGEIQIASIKLIDSSGKVARQWDFTEDQ